MSVVTEEPVVNSSSHPHVPYFLIFLALLGCTLVSVVLDIVEMPKTVLVVLVLAVACAKALFVMVYFMHLKFEGKWKFVLLAPTAILAIGLPIALLPDIGLHYYEDLSPQQRYAEEFRQSPTPGHGQGDGAKHGPANDTDGTAPENATSETAAGTD